MTFMDVYFLSCLIVSTLNVLVHVVVVFFGYNHYVELKTAIVLGMSWVLLFHPWYIGQIYRNLKKSGYCYCMKFSEGNFLKFSEGSLQKVRSGPT